MSGSLQVWPNPDDGLDPWPSTSWMQAGPDEHELGKLSNLASRDGQWGHGIYLMTDCSDECMSSSGQQFLRLILEDATGKVMGFVWPESLAAVTPPALYAPVTVHAQVRMYGEESQLCIKALQAAPGWQLPPACSLLPIVRCPDKALPALDRLARLEQELPYELSRFIRLVLLDPAIGIAFMRCRASARHHHAYAGGLLVHSTEMLESTAAMVRSILPGDEWSPHLAQVAYLFHDLGKLRSVGEIRRPAYPFACRHELMEL